MALLFRKFLKFRTFKCNWLNSNFLNSESNNMNFKASLDSTAKAITVVVTSLFTGLIAYGFVTYSNSNSILYTAAFLTIVYFICWLLRPLRYSVTETDLLIERPMGNIKIKKEDIQSIEILQESNIGGTVRTFGVGGLFGYYGKYYNSTFGSMNWYVTRIDKPVLITTAKSKIVVSPDEPDRFAETLRKIN